MVTLRAKAKVLRSSARQAEARVVALEAEVARLEAAARPARAAAGKAAPAQLRRQQPERDPGDAVPPGVAVQEPAPLDDEAKAALAKLEELSGS